PRRRVDTELKKTSRVGQETNPFAGREPSLTVLAFYSFCAPAFPNLLFLVVHLRHQVRHKTHVGFIAAGRGSTRVARIVEFGAEVVSTRSAMVGCERLSD